MFIVKNISQLVAHTLGFPYNFVNISVWKIGAFGRFGIIDKRKRPDLFFQVSEQPMAFFNAVPNQCIIGRMMDIALLHNLKQLSIMLK